MIAVLLLAVAAVTMTTACEQVMSTPATPGTSAGAGAGGGGAAPTPAPTPTPAPAEPMRWALEADHFGDDNATIWAQTSNRSAPFEWDRIAPGKVSVSIGGLPLPITNQAYPPAFADDYSGAEWTLAAEVTEGQVVLVLTARNQRRNSGKVKSIQLTAGGSGYTSAPTITLTGDGSGAAATATHGADQVASITMTNAGNGYTVPPIVTITGGGATTDATAAAYYSRHVISAVTVTGAGSGYGSIPTVSFSGGSGAAATAVGPTGIRSFNIVDAGWGYRQVTYSVTCPTPSGGVAAAGRAVIVNQAVSSITVLNPGRGYTTIGIGCTIPPPGGGFLPGKRSARTTTVVLEDTITGVSVTTPGVNYDETTTVTFSAVSGATAATAEVVLGLGVKARVVNPGSGYTSAPTVTFAAPPAGASSVTATATAALGPVTEVTLTDGGSGYTTAPAVTFSGPGTGAAAVAELGLTGNDEAGNLYFARQTLYGKELVIELTEDATGS